MKNDQGMDDTPQVWYYDKATQLGFIYDGTVGEAIDVSEGGFGEPTKFRFPFPPSIHRDMKVTQFLAHFGRLCYEYARAYEAREVDG